MTGRLEALLGLHARRVFSHNQLIAALTLAGVSDPEAVIAAPTLVDLPVPVHIEPSPLLNRWRPVSYDDCRAEWGVGTQL